MFRFRTLQREKIFWKCLFDVSEINNSGIFENVDKSWRLVSRPYRYSIYSSIGNSNVQNCPFSCFSDPILGFYIVRLFLLYGLMRLIVPVLLVHFWNLSECWFGRYHTYRYDFSRIFRTHKITYLFTCFFGFWVFVKSFWYLNRYYFNIRRFKKV